MERNITNAGTKLASAKPKSKRAVVANNGRPSPSRLAKGNRTADKRSKRSPASTRAQAPKRLHVNTDPIARRRALGGLPHPFTRPDGAVQRRVVTEEFLIINIACLVGIGAMWLVDSRIGQGALIGYALGLSAFVGRRA